MKKVASIRKTRTAGELINWIDTLPIEVSDTAFKILLEKSKDKQYVLWRRGLGFRFFK